MDNYNELFKPSFLKKENRPALPEDASVTMAYVPLQLELVTYDEEKALRNGTLFPVLNKPFKGRMVEDA
ncbi:MAG: spore coat associated protein CotJA [Eubacteriales bacterium]|nr:spore coat associated protein CotJA [Eubacteriales bacterium]